jgi:murein DD-endopeptidase MepM/ murein hydrolase activator NlpD
MVRGNKASSDSLTGTRNSSANTIGFNNASKLLMSLANNSNKRNPSVNNWMSEDLHQDLPPSGTDDLEEIVGEIFRRLDVDGDGSISWWEWKSVLTASICNGGKVPNQSPKSIDPVDPLLITVFAAASAISASPTSQAIFVNDRFCEEVNRRDVETWLNNLRSKIGLEGKYPHANSDGGFQHILPQEGLKPIDEFVSMGDLGKSKVASRLNSMVQSLRYNNNLLSKRLEEALAISQQLEIASDTKGRTEASQKEVLDEYQRQLNVIRLQEQVQALDKQSTDYLQQLEKAKSRGDHLATSLLEQQAALQILKQRKAMDAQLRRQQQEALMLEINERNQLLTDKIVKKKRRFKAVVVLQMFMVNVVIPKWRQKARLAAEKKIAQAISSSVCRKRYEQNRANVFGASVKIQKVFRGFRCRKSLLNRKRAAVKIRCCVRNWISRRKVKSRKAKKSRIFFLLKKNLATVVIKYWRAWKSYRRNKSAKVITGAVRRVNLQKRFSIRKVAIEKKRWMEEQERLYQEEQRRLKELQRLQAEKENEAASILQRQFRSM